MRTGTRAAMARPAAAGTMAVAALLVPAGCGSSDGARTFDRQAELEKWSGSYPTDQATCIVDALQVYYDDGGRGDPRDNVVANCTTEAIPVETGAPPPEETVIVAATAAPDTTSAGPGRELLPPLRFSSPREYQYEISVTLDDFTPSVELADPGKSRLTASFAWTITVQNLLDDRPAPFDTTVDNNPGIGLLVELDPAVAQLVKDQQGSVYSVNGKPYVYANPLLVFNDFDPAEGVAELPAGGSHTLSARAGSAFGVESVRVFGGEQGWPEPLIDALSTAIRDGPDIVVFSMDYNVIEGQTCQTDGGLFSGRLTMVHTPDSATWQTPDELGWTYVPDSSFATPYTVCSPPEWA